MSAAELAGGRLGAVTVEVIRNRLLSVTEEMRIALQSVSGSPTVTEATDFFTGLYLPEGSSATMGFQVTHEASVVGSFIRHIGERSGPGGTLGIGPADMFIGNDPYLAALHQNDVQMAAPIFVGGELVAWAGVMAHETDMGGMDFASWSPTAREVYQEGLRIPCVKLVDGGRIRHDVLELILTASRLPAALGLDVRAFIATLNVARERVGALAERYGAPAIAAVMKEMIERSARAVRERLRSLPDATVHTWDFLEHDGHENRLYKIDLVADKRGDRLRLDFSGSSPQAPGFINATRAGLLGGVTGGAFSSLAFGIPWNQGVMEPLEVVAPDGLVCTARHPAPVGSATVETIWVVTNVVVHAVNLLLATSPELGWRAQATSCGTMATFNMGGVNQFGERFGLHLLDPLAGGFGAWADRDGLDGAGPPAVPQPAIADVESNEQVAPLRYLYRRLCRDTGGAGRRRGGRGAEMALTVSGVDSVEILVMTHGAEVPNGIGLFGGMPGATVRQRIGLKALPGGAYSAGGMPEDPALLGGEWRELGPKPGRMRLSRDDVFAVSWQGGGGSGDPLEREPERVGADVGSGAVSAEAAERLYGVVLVATGVDLVATGELRNRRCAERLAAAAARGAEPGARDAGAGRPEPEDGAGPPVPLGGGLVARPVEGGFEVLSPSGALLASGSTAWRAGTPALAIEVPSLHSELAVTASISPDSGRLLSVDVDRAGVLRADDLILVPAAAAGGSVTGEPDVPAATEPVGRGARE